MSDCHAVAAFLAAAEDPRLESVRCVEGAAEDGRIVVVGVVHDHPASVARAALVTDGLDPSTLALELPPLAIALFRAYADDVPVPPRLGGEMSAAIQAAPNARLVGIDGPNADYLVRVFDALRGEWVRDESTRWSAVRAVLQDVTSGLAHALACRVAAPLVEHTPLTPRLYSPHSYDCSLLDAPEIQADDEADHIAQRQAFLRAIDPPLPLRFVDAAREASMITRLRQLRTDGDVVAIVGIEHVDPICDALEQP